MRVVSLVFFLVSGALAAGLGPWTSLGTALFFLGPDVPSAIQSGFARSLPTWFWNPLMTTILSWPSWIFPLAVALFSLLLTIGRPNRRA
jgi:hypothetical protein